MPQSPNTFRFELKRGGMLGSYVKRPILPIFQPPIFSSAAHSQTEIGNPQPLMKG